MRHAALVFVQFYSFLYKLPSSTLAFVLGSKNLIVRRLWLTVPLTIWATAFYQLNPLLIKFQVDSLTENWESIWDVRFGDVLLVFGLFVVVDLLMQLLDAMFSYFQQLALFRLKQDTIKYLEDRFTNFLKRFDGSFLSGENNLRIIRTLQWNLDTLQEKLVDFLAKSVELITGFVAIIFILPFFHPYLLIIILITSVVDLVLDGLQNNRWRQFELVEQRQSEQASELKWRYIWYFNIFLQNNWLNQVYDIYRNRRKKHMQTQYEQRLVDKRFQLFRDVSRVCLYAVATLVAGNLVIQGVIPIGTFVVFSFYVSRLQNQFKLIGEVFRIYLETRFDLLRFDFLLQLKPKIDTADTSEFAPQSIEKISLNEVSFVYPSFFQEEKDYISIMQQRLGIEISSQPPSGWLPKIWWKIRKFVAKNIPNSKKKYLQKEIKEIEKIMQSADSNKEVLRGVEMTFERGKIYGIVGYNGAGKTTLMKILKRSLDVSSGTVQIDGRNIKTIEPEVWRKHIASLEQNNYLIESLSVFENLQIGADTPLDRSEVEKLCQSLGITTFVPNLDALIGEGVELSGGQEQLLEMARILAQKKPLLTLDEGTNQMDAEKESMIFNLLQKSKQDRITLFISHRMTTIRKCDQIIVMQKGKVQAQGTPEELLQAKKANLFQRFWKLQVENQQ